jgi:hypothetical protein
MEGYNMKSAYLLLALTLMFAQSTQATLNKAVDEQHNDSANKSSEDADIAGRWGVDDFIVRLSGGGYMLDIRYRVVDAAKAKKEFFKDKFQPFIIQESTGRRFTVPSSAKVGFMRQKPKSVETNKRYFMMLANPAQAIQTGETITLEIGDVRIPGLTVQ